METSFKEPITNFSIPYTCVLPG